MPWKEVRIDDSDMVKWTNIKINFCCDWRNIVTQTKLNDRLSLLKAKNFLKARKARYFLYEDDSLQLILAFYERKRELPRLNKSIDEVRLCWGGGLYKPTEDMDGMPNSVLINAVLLIGQKIVDFLNSINKTECYAIIRRGRLTNQAWKWFDACVNIWNTQMSNLQVIVENEKYIFKVI